MENVVYSLQLSCNCSLEIVNKITHVENGGLKATPLNKYVLQKGAVVFNTKLEILFITIVNN